MIEGREGVSGSMSKLLGSLGEIGEALADRAWSVVVWACERVLTFGVADEPDEF